MTEVLFYHLERGSVLDVLPPLLEKCLERGWRVGVEAGAEAALEPLDQHLWTFRDDSFLPHGVVGGAHDAAQPILLSASSENANKADVRFLIEGASPQAVEGYTRVVLIFDGRDDEALKSAREHWKTLKDSGHTLTYWQQGDRGWERKA